MITGFNSMYRTPQTTANQEFNSDLESKYRVAEILSSMQSSSGLTPTVIGTPYTTSSGTGLTPLLTPTTLANIEQTFISLQEPTTSASSLNRESGFVPPVVVLPNIATQSAQMPVMVQVKSEVDYDTDYSSHGSESEYGAPAAKRGRYAAADQTKLNIPDIDHNTYLVKNSRRPTGPRKIKKEENLTPEDEAKRDQRRERNKVAAAKCRKRREDVTNTLIVETESLEEEKNQLESEIVELRQQKEQFEFLLEAHKNTCQHKHQQPLNLAPPKTTATMTAFQASQISKRPEMSISLLSAMGGLSTARPNSLPISIPNAVSTVVTEALGIPITTPSTGIFGFDTMAAGHTGLTPLTGIASSCIATPTSQSCSGQVQTAQRRSTDSNSSTELSSPTLMAL